jgi:hypothetical protein
MSNNRAEQQAIIDGLTATVDLIEDKAARSQDGYVFKKDMVGTKSISGTGSEILSFAAIDQFTVTLTGAGVATITIQDLEIGQKGKILITKAVASMNIIIQGCDNVDIGELLRTGSFYLEVVNIGGEVVMTQLGEGRKGTIASVSSTTNFTVAQVFYIRYEIIGNRCIVDARISGTVTSAGDDFALKFTGREFGTLLYDNDDTFDGISGSAYVARSSGSLTNSGTAAIQDDLTTHTIRVFGSELFTSAEMTIVSIHLDFEIK